MSSNELEAVVSPHCIFLVTYHSVLSFSMKKGSISLALLLCQNTSGKKKKGSVCTGAALEKTALCKCILNVNEWWGFFFFFCQDFYTNTAVRQIGNYRIEKKPFLALVLEYFMWAYIKEERFAFTHAFSESKRRFKFKQKIKTMITHFKLVLYSSLQQPIACFRNILMETGHNVRYI